MPDAHELDVTRIEPHIRHATIFATFDALNAGESFVIVNDHDPAPLRFQFQARHPRAFEWDYLELGPRTWKVRLTRT
ncbi:DUF2249 domain-containing protein [Lujinxingia vulgaris]|uniref:DUF2249 domain-containing protein n=1 Tax=Lujinxingia vulgaris TaxID=2600176 RepID=A0A5C6XHX2_9DELT|nr:DUF2249 domain-containing protein [Lujinxingia vulgaris]TXD37125.1 DUF2249 domain-containing protein [Lujinxingia vulgaris]